MNLRKYIVGKYVGFSILFVIAMPIVWFTTRDWASVALCLPPAASVPGTPDSSARVSQIHSTHRMILKLNPNAPQGDIHRTTNRFS